MPGLPLSDSPVGKLGNLLFPNLFFLLGNSAFALLSGQQKLIQLLVHTCSYLPAQQMPAKALTFRKKEDGAVLGTPAAAHPPTLAGLCPAPRGPILQPEMHPGVLPTPNRSQGQRCSWRPWAPESWGLLRGRALPRCPAPPGVGRDGTGQDGAGPVP